MAKFLTHEVFVPRLTTNYLFKLFFFIFDHDTSPDVGSRNVRRENVLQQI